MKDVGSKPESFRSALASARLRVPPNAMALLRSGETEKGDPLATARIAGILAAKRTDEILPLCHPLPLQHAELRFELGETEVTVYAEAQTIAPTGVEMEALTAAAVAALCLYDMLKPYCDQSELAITDTHLVEKTGGKSHFPRKLSGAVSGAVIEITQGVSHFEAGVGEMVVEALGDAGFAPLDHRLVDDAEAALDAALRDCLAEGAALVLTVGGTGIGDGDRAAATVGARLSTELPGLIETARAFGQRRSPGAMLMQGAAGLVGNAVVVTLPGTLQGAQESLSALLPGVVGLLEMQRGGS